VSTAQVSFITESRHIPLLPAGLVLAAIAILVIGVVRLIQAQK
jgi:hypothetical protein